MPFYDYRCQKCDHEFEKMFKMSECDVPLNEPCPSCGLSGSIEKLLGATKVAYLSEQGFAKKIPQDFRNFLGMMKKANPNGYIKDR